MYKYHTLFQTDDDGWLSTSKLVWMLLCTEVPYTKYTPPVWFDVSLNNKATSIVKCLAQRTRRFFPSKISFPISHLLIIF